MPNFIVGAQKKMVLGPAGWFQNAAADCMRPAMARVGSGPRRRAEDGAGTAPRCSLSGRAHRWGSGAITITSDPDETYLRDLFITRYTYRRSLSSSYRNS